MFSITKLQRGSFATERYNGWRYLLLHNSLLFKLRQDISHSDDKNETIVIEIINKN